MTIAGVTGFSGGGGGGGELLLDLELTYGHCSRNPQNLYGKDHRDLGCSQSVICQFQLCLDTTPLHTLEHLRGNCGFNLPFGVSLHCPVVSPPPKKNRTNHEESEEDVITIYRVKTVAFLETVL